MSDISVEPEGQHTPRRLVAKSGWLSISVVSVVAAIIVYGAFPHPTRNPATLKAISIESQRLLSTNSVKRGRWAVSIPKHLWPPAIARLQPDSIRVSGGAVEITIRPFLDGGWGYGFARNKQDLPMLQSCWSELGEGMFWHGPC